MFKVQRTTSRAFFPRRVLHTRDYTRSEVIPASRACLADSILPSQKIQETFRTQASSKIQAKDREFGLFDPLMDKFGRKHTYLRISLTEKCNLRCRYCMPAEGVPTMPRDQLLTAEEISRLAKLFVAQGVDKIRLTGGEPTLRKDLASIMTALQELKSSGINGKKLQQIGITTNGILLHRMLPGLFDSGLTNLNVSIDTLDPYKFELMTRRSAAGLQKVLDGLDLAISLGMPSIKINVVVLRGINDKDDVISFMSWAKDKPITIRFIEYMPFEGNRWQTAKMVPFTELIDTITTKFGELERLSDDKNDTTKHFRVPGHRSTVGFITSMTQHFCNSCNRVRITADGNIKACLFGSAEVSLRDALRKGLHDSDIVSDEELLSLIARALHRKHARHGGLASLSDLANASSENRSMIRIGG